MIDDTGFAKKGKHSVGVARQYSGTLGRTDNCQVMTSVHLAGDLGSVMVGERLYLPKEWTDDRAAEKHTKGRPPGEEQWLLCEWQSCDASPKSYFSTLPANTSLKELVRITKLRWRVERDYQDLKAEVGLDHFEGRTWRGFHRHATLCAVAHGFLALRRALFPPRSRIKWTLPEVRRQLQQLLLERIGWCPLCARPFRSARPTPRHELRKPIR